MPGTDSTEFVLGELMMQKMICRMKSLSFCAEEWLRKITTGISQDFGSFCIFLEEKSMIKHEKHLEMDFRVPGTVVHKHPINLGKC